MRYSGGRFVHGRVAVSGGRYTVLSALGIGDEREGRRAMGLLEVARGELAVAERRVETLREVERLLCGLEEASSEGAAAGRGGGPLHEGRRVPASPRVPRKAAKGSRGGGRSSEDGARVRERIVALVRSVGSEGIPQADVAARLDLSTQQVRRYVGELQERKAVSQRGARRGSNGGRPSPVLVAGDAAAEPPSSRGSVSGHGPKVNGNGTGPAPGLRVAKVSDGTLDGRIMEALGSPRSPAQLVESLGVELSVLMGRLHALERDDEVQRGGAGLWLAVP